MDWDYITWLCGLCLEIILVLIMLFVCSRLTHKMEESQLRERLILRQSLAAAQQLGTTRELVFPLMENADYFAKQVFAQLMHVQGWSG